MGIFFPNRRTIIWKQHCVRCNYDVVEEWKFINVIFDANQLFYCLCVSINFNSVYFTLLFDLLSVECCSLFINYDLEIYIKEYQKLITFFM